MYILALFQMKPCSYTQLITRVNNVIHGCMSKIISIFISDDMVEHENETMRDRVADLEKRVHDQSDEITCLRATLADALRRINELEDGKSKISSKY